MLDLNQLITPRRLPILQLIWGLLFLIVLGSWIYATWAKPSEELLYEVIYEITTPIIYFALAAFLFWRGRRESMAILTSLMLIFFGPFLVLGIGTVNWYEGAVPAWLWLTLTLGGIGALIIILFLFYFPSGRFAPRWGGWVVAALLLLNVAEILGLYHINPFLGPILFILCMLLGLIGQIYRYRYLSNVVEKQQARWAALTASGPMLALVLWLLVENFALLPLPSLLVLILNSVLILLLPIGITIAVLRYRLYDIDLIIRRTLHYSILSGCLAAVYFITVALIQNIISSVGGQPSAVIIVLSTLLVAALFNPLRLRIQAFIDSRFFRQKYDAQAMLARFAETARDEVEMDRLTSAMLQIVLETMQPESMSVWLKPTADGRQRIDGGGPYERK